MTKTDRSYSSQYGQDRAIDELLSKKVNGYFVDIGAHDGVTYSNTLFFEKERGWKGMCFEPIPEVFAKCILNRASKCVNAAISDKTEKLKFTIGTQYVEMLSGITKFRDQKHIERTERDRLLHGGSVREIEVQAYNLNELLNQEGITHIDFITLDIEGGELEVLKSIDFRRTKVKTIAVELNYPEVERSVRSLLGSNGFLFVCRLGADGIFVSKEHFSWNTAFFRYYFSYRIRYLGPFLLSRVRRLF